MTRLVCTGVGLVACLLAADASAEGQKAWSTLDALDQYGLVSDSEDPLYVADALEPKLSESGRLAFLTQCLRRNRGAVFWALCQADAAAFDPQKVLAEVAADKSHNQTVRDTVKSEAQAMPAQLKEHAAAVKEVIGKDPAYAKMFGIAATTGMGWGAVAKTNASLLQLVTAMDDARATQSRRAFEGCDAKTWPAWTAAVSGIPAKKFTTVHDTNTAESLELATAIAVNDPAGYLASTAHYVCHSGDSTEPDALVRYLGEALQRWPGFRGPRNAALTTILAAGLELDDRSAKIEYPGVDREWFKRAGGWHSWGRGVIGTIKPAGAKHHIEFKTQTIKQMRCVSEQHTHRINGIRSNGEFTFEINCLKSAMVDVDVTSQPQDVSARYAAGLKPGMQVTVVEDVAAVTWAKAGAAAPSMIGAAPVK